MHKSLPLLCVGALVFALPISADDELEAIVSEEIPYTEAAQATTRVWGTAEYLLLWTKESPGPVPLITNDGALGLEGIDVLLGGRDVNLDPSSGFRGTSGWWIDAEQTWGMEVGGFYLGRGSQSQSLGADASGSPTLTIPFFDAQLGTENFTYVSFPGVFTGTATLNVSSELYGLEANIVRHVFPSRRSTILMLTGFRYVNLYETLNFSTTTELISPLSGSLTTLDNFRTFNEFYGGQLGASADRYWGVFFVKAATKVALGAMHQTVRINGSSTATPNNAFQAPTYFPGGYFAVPTNSGTFFNEAFTVIPQVDLTIGVQLTDNVRATVGYTFLFLSSVMRPGDQMDRVINPTQSPAFDSETLLVGTARPQPLLNTSGYWAQGLTAGLELVW